MRQPPDNLFRLVRDTDPDVLDTDDLATYMRHVADLKAWCDARLVRATRRQRTLATEGHAGDPRSLLSRHGRTSSKEAAAAAGREQVCTTMPGFEDALTNGTVSAGHVDAIACATKDLDDTERSEFVGEADSLLDQAADHSVDAFAKSCRDLARSIRARHNAQSDIDELERQRAQSKISRWIDQATGMHKTLIEADPVTDRIIWTAIQHQRGQLRQRNQTTGGPKPSWDRLTIDALIEAVTTDTDTTSDSDSGSGGHGDERGESGGVRRRGHPTIVVHIDADTLRHGLHEHSICETDSGINLPVETVRHLACDADIIPIVLNGNSVVLDQGRSKRLATTQQRRAIEAMQTTCSHPDCTVTIDDCRIHHLNPWSQGGATDLCELAPVCEPHHHLIHEGGWTLTITPDRIATWTKPDGHTYWTGPLTNRHPTAA
jgi:hypothetical protein